MLLLLVVAVVVLLYCACKQYVMNFIIYEGIILETASADPDRYATINLCGSGNDGKERRNSLDQRTPGIASCGKFILDIYYIQSISLDCVAVLLCSLSVTRLCSFYW